MRILRPFGVLPALRMGLWASLCSAAVPANAQVLLVDNFDDTSGPAVAQGDGRVNVAAYRVPFGGTTGDDFVGRTNFGFTLPAENVAAGVAGSTDNKVAVLPLSTYNANAPGASFLGTDLITKQNFAVGGGVRMTTRMRVAGPVPGGLVAAPFLYDVQRESPPGTLVRDEIDHELLTNNAQSAGPDNTFTNIWNDGNFASGGAGQTISNPAGFDITQFHDYRIDWAPSSVKWYIDNTLVRTETTVVPNDPMRAHWNFWAPDSSFTAAYNAALTPTATSPGTTYNVELDKVQIERFNTTTSANLLADPSFELGTAPIANGTGGWTKFNNAFLDTAEIAPQDGTTSLKVYGPFTGGPNASGAFQNVPALAGQQYSASIYAYSPSVDSIIGNNNFTNVTLQFVNGSGAVIGSVNFSPGTNEKNTPIFDGRDPLMVQNEWVKYSVDAVAPTGTAFVRMSAFFIQLNNQGGAVFFDNASLTQLTAQATFLPTDFNHDGAVNGTDLGIWKTAYGTTAAGDATGDGASNGSDFLLWQRQFGTTPAAAAVGAVPEPAAILLAAFAAAAALVGIRRFA